METVTAEHKQSVIMKPEEFRPVNDEYQPFRIVESRNWKQENLEVPLFVKLMMLPQHKRVLEIGCGPGIALAPLAKQCRPLRLVGIDIDDVLLARAEKRLKERRIMAELYQEDVRRLPFPDGSFDIVVDFGTCYHINRRVMALREITRVLAKGGIFAYETKFNQLLSHPVRSFRSRIPWHMAPLLEFRGSAVMWSSRVKKCLKLG